jgi:hypothetical protein
MSFAQWILIGIATVALVIGVSLLFARIAAFNESELESNPQDVIDSARAQLAEGQDYAPDDSLRNALGEKTNPRERAISER